MTDEPELLERARELIAEFHCWSRQHGRAVPQERCRQWIADYMETQND